MRCAMLKSTIPPSSGRCSYSTVVVTKPTKSQKGAGPPQPAVDPTTGSLETRITASGDFDVLSVDYRITESNNVWSRFSWRLKVRNKSGASRVFGGQIEFQDEDGFIVDVGSVAAEMVPGGREQVLTGFVLINAHSAGKVTQCVGKIRPQR